MIAYIVQLTVQVQIHVQVRPRTHVFLKARDLTYYGPYFMGFSLYDIGYGLWTDRCYDH